MPVLTLPRLVAGRALAETWVHDLGDVRDQQVVVDAGRLVNSTASFAAQLVRSILVDGHAAELVLVSGPTDFGNDVKTAADDLEVSDRVRYSLDAELTR